MEVYKEKKSGLVFYILLFISVITTIGLYWYYSKNAFWFLKDDTAIETPFEQVKVNDLYINNLIVVYNGIQYNLTEILIKLNKTFT